MAEGKFGKYTVRFYADTVSDPEVKIVEYGKNIVDVQPQMKLNGKTVLSWSQQPDDVNGERIYSGEIISDLTLYAAEFAPMIELDSNGGEYVNPIIAHSGNIITLPIAKRENYKFMGWYDSNGNKFSSNVMPENNIRLSAKWQAIISFNTFGGSSATNISEPQGTIIELPITEKDGYSFAGWYDNNDRQYIDTIMPSYSIELFAKYYKIKVILKELIASNAEVISYDETPNMDKSLILDLGDIYNSGVTNINVTVSYLARVRTNTTGITSMVWYKANIAHIGNRVWEYSDAAYTSVNSWCSQTYSTELKLDTDKYYICLCHNGWSSAGIWKNFAVDISYVDTSILY